MKIIKKKSPRALRPMRTANLGVFIFRANALDTDIRRYFVRDMVSAGVIKLVPLRTHLMVADALTKSLPSPAHIKHREIMLGYVQFSFLRRVLLALCAAVCVLSV